MTTRFPFLLFALALSHAGAQAQRSALLPTMPRDLETAFALSAAPPHLRDSASVYLLDPARGYFEARAGTNGFRCLVVRTEWNRPSRPFPDDVFVPECWDAAGTQAILNARCRPGSELRRAARRAEFALFG